MSPIEKDPAAGVNGAVATVFRAERGALGMTFEDLATQSGVPVRSLMRFLNGQRHMDVSVIAAIAEALDMTPAEVLEAAQARLAKAAADVPQLHKAHQQPDAPIQQEAAREDGGYGQHESGVRDQP